MTVAFAGRQHHVWQIVDTSVFGSTVCHMSRHDSGRLIDPRGDEAEPPELVFFRSALVIRLWGGTRVTLIGRLGSARLRLQLDVGIGDAVKSEPEWIEYPSLLDLPRPRLRCYRPETSIAEKVYAMVVLGTRNSRMRDFFDVFMLRGTGPLMAEHSPRR